MKTNTVRSSAPSLADRLKDITQYSEVKRLADNLMLLQRQKQFRSLAVLSLFPGEGKTLFCALMAQAYSDAFQARVLVVDTTTFRHPQSLSLRQCFDPGHPLIECISLEEYRKGSNGNSHHEPTPNESVLQAEILPSGPITMLVRRESDQFLIRKLAEERAANYGLILLDTAPLSTFNKGNVDPMVVARMADASIAVVNPNLLKGAQLDVQLATLKDPAMHLIGLISNEEFLQ
jgi:Mrp family chromosome partitioning ATPase